MPECAECKKEISFFEVAEGVCDGCREKRHRQAVQNVILTTSIDVPRRITTGIQGIVSAEAAIGISIFKDIANNWRDFLGGRSDSVQKILKEARAACLFQLKSDAFELKADAVIAVTIAYNEVSTSGSGGGILFVAATGTAVTLET